MISKACSIDHPRPKAVKFCFSRVISESAFFTNLTLITSATMVKHKQSLNIKLNKCKIVISKACSIDHPRPKAVKFCFSRVISESAFFTNLTLITSATMVLLLEKG